MRFRWIGLALFAAVIMGTDGEAQAQAFQCTQAVAGQLSEQAGVQCECRFFHASAMAGTPAGYRWDCGILRPRVRTSVLPRPHAFTPIYILPPVVSGTGFFGPSE